MKFPYPVLLKMGRGRRSLRSLWDGKKKNTRREVPTGKMGKEFIFPKGSMQEKA